MDRINLARVDFRLMHGQVVTGWMKQVSADTILIIDDELDKDKFLSKVFLMSAPPNTKVGIRSVESAVKGFKKNIFKSKNILILFKSVESALQAIKLGLPITQLQIGGLGSGDNKVSVSDEISVDRHEFKKLQEISEQNINITFHVTPTGRAIKFDVVKDKLREKLL